MIKLQGALMLAIILTCPSCSSQKPTAEKGTLVESMISLPKPEPKKVIPSRIGYVEGILNQCPGWLNLDPSDRRTTDQMLRSLDKISMERTEIIREAESRYMNSYRRSIYAGSKIYVLHRYIFNLPVSEPISRRQIGGFAGAPFTKTAYDSLWPLSKDGHGHLSITGRCGGYYGAPYQFLGEFDYLLKTYGRRLPPK